MLPFYWDKGRMDNHGSAIFKRNENSIFFDAQALKAILECLN